MRHLLPLMLVLATGWASKPIFESVAPQVIQDIEDDYKLPDNVIPTNYVIELTPDFKNFTFEGNSQIDLKIQHDTETIIFHFKNIVFNNITLTYTNPGENFTTIDILLNNFTSVELKDFGIVNLTNPITNKTTNVRLTLDYTGVLNDELRGFYRSSYQAGNKTRWLATTHFEPVGARQAFPCWDEPAIKATFQIIINVPEDLKDYNAISNTPQSKESKEKRIVFEKTPPMSTYLVAFVVSDYKSLENKEKNLGVWTKPDAINSTNFALKIGQETLNKLKNFTGIDYYRNMTKMDQISIPDFAAGAMENWGLVTYRESSLLYTENKTTTQNKQSIATVIAHEFSHQWFGNLVTCEWWNYIWLNEGFATFFQYYITEQVVNSDNENWRLMEQFVVKDLQASAFITDATTKTRSLNSENSAAITPTQIHSLFDNIAYQKGGSILRMLQQFLTEDVFQNGIKQYLTDNQFKPVNPEQFLKAIEKAENERVKKVLPANVSLNTVMENWLNKPGYPVVTVTRVAGSSNKVNLTQERFFLPKPTEEDAINETKWYIPLTFVTEQAPNNVISIWMKNEAMEHTIDKLDNKTWILFNKNQIGYYRVNYDLENWNLLANYLRGDYYKNISHTNRAQLIDDALNLARAGFVPYNVSLQITVFLYQETDYIPWYAAVRVFNYLDNLLQDKETREKFHIYVAKRIEAFAKAVEYDKPEEGTHVTKLGKVLALNTACKYGLEDCENFANEEFKEWLTKDKKLSPDLRSAIICAGLRNADVDAWIKAVEKYKNSKDNNERADILLGLGCAKSEEIINKFLNLTIEENPNINTFSAINSIFEGNVQSFNILLDFINEHIETIKKTDKNETQLTALVKKLVNRVTNVEQYGELTLFTDKYLHNINKLTFGPAIENLAWIKSYGEDVEAWVKENYNQNDSSASSFTLASFLVLIPILLARFN